VAFLFAVEVSAFGSPGSGGGSDVEVDVEVVGVDIVEVEPVRPTEALVCPPLVSQGFGGDGEAIYTDDRRHSPRHEGAQEVFKSGEDGLRL